MLSFNSNGWNNWISISCFVGSWLVALVGKFQRNDATKRRRFAVSGWGNIKIRVYYFKFLSP